ncbi:Leucine rich repeat containing protein [Euroglyphus maynei]|uniref:Leucine rich repeat containing protein n=1 Tax=Euroglyphus maynei TaxID=6958 RepID=A0A1Y3B1K9_EURMA|nr:Leucine rich repeat containing protein [Euroglyphus maynei]
MRFDRTLCYILLFALAVIVDGKELDATTAATTNNSVANGNVCELKQCSCVNSTSDVNGRYNHFVDCSHRRLTKVPLAKTLPHPTRHLDLSMNNITVVEKFESIEQLNRLSLATNGLREIDHFAFEQLPNLVALDLSYNELEEIPATLFNDLSELQFLNLSHNRFKFIPVELFKSNAFLHELNLAHNKIQFIQPDTFSYLGQLQILSLASNSFYSIATGMFHRLEKLEQLDLSGNDFQYVPTNALHLLKQLQFLDLSENPIRVLDMASFHQLTSILELKLNKMPSLVRIEKRTFSTLKNLQRLSIEDNPHLSTIDENAFVAMFDRQSISIKYVSLRRNQLSWLSEKTLPFFLNPLTFLSGNLTYLDLRQNPWNCDCNVRWMHYCHGAPEFEKDIMCSTPKLYSGQELVTIETKNLRCKSNQYNESHYLFFLSLFFMTGLFLSIMMLIFREKLVQFYGKRHRTNEGSIYYVRAQSEQME